MKFEQALYLLVKLQETERLKESWTADHKTSLIVTPLSKLLKEMTHGLEKQSEIAAASQELFKALQKKPVDYTKVESYWFRYLNLYKNYLATELVQDLQQIKQLTQEQAVTLLEIVENDIFPVLPTSLIFLLAARLLAKDIPDISYSYTIKAFERNPHLAGQFGESYKNYVYQSVEEDYYEICPICGSEDAEPFYNAQIFLAAGFNNTFAPAKLWCHCNQCQNHFVYNLPKEIYNAQTDFTLTSEINEIGQIVKAPLQSLAIYGDIIRAIRQYNEGKRYLEVGVGRGEFIAVAKEMGLEIHAVELSASTCKNIELLLGVPVVQADFLAYDSEEPYDVLSMGDVIEHVKAPTEAIQKANALLKSGGILWISTPNYNSAFSQMLKFSDPMWKEPGHRVYFCRETFEQLLEACGFDILEYQVSRRYNGSMEIIARKR